MNGAADFGVVTGLAELLGFIATGIEIDEPLAESSVVLLSHHQLEAKILTGSYFDLPVSADVVFVYCWPGRMPDTRARFVEIGTSGSLLMMCHGASDIRCQTYDDVLTVIYPTPWIRSHKCTLGVCHALRRSCP